MHLLKRQVSDRELGVMPARMRVNLPDRREMELPDRGLLPIQFAHTEQVIPQSSGCRLCEVIQQP